MALTIFDDSYDIRNNSEYTSIIHEFDGARWNDNYQYKIRKIDPQQNYYDTNKIFADEDEAEPAVTVRERPKREFNNPNKREFEKITFEGCRFM